MTFTYDIIWKICSHTWARCDIAPYRKKRYFIFVAWHKVHQQLVQICSSQWKYEYLKHYVGREWEKRSNVSPVKCINQDRHTKEIASSSRLSFTVVGLCFGLWGSVGTNAVSHHPPGSQLPITVLLFLTDQPANPSQRATVKIQTHLDNTVTRPLKCLSLILLSESRILSFALCVAQSVLSLSLSPISLTHTNTNASFFSFFYSCEVPLSNIYLYLSPPCFTSLDRAHLLKCSIPVITFLSQFSLFSLSLFSFSAVPSCVVSSRQRHPEGDH